MPLSGKPSVLTNAWILHPAAALFVIYVILGVRYEIYIHPITILSTLPSAGVGALLTLFALHIDSRSSA